MTLVRSFKDIVEARVERDPEFRDALLTEGPHDDKCFGSSDLSRGRAARNRSNYRRGSPESVERLLSGELELGRALLCQVIGATIGFERLAVETGTSTESLMSMLEPDTHPAASNLFGIIGNLQRAWGIHLVEPLCHQTSFAPEQGSP